MITTDAAEVLLAELQPALARFCRTRLGARTYRHTSAEDVMQEVLLSTITALPRFQGSANEFPSFVYGIARHKIVDHYRERERDRSIPTDALPEAPDRLPSPDRVVLNWELGTQLAEALDTLNARQRRFVELRIVVGLSGEETARAMGTTPGAVRVGLHRALAEIRRHCRLSDGVLTVQPVRRRRRPRCAGRGPEPAGGPRQRSPQPASPDS